MSYDITVKSLEEKIKQILKPCFHCTESLNVRIRHEKEDGVPLGWSLAIDCPNCRTQLTDVRFLKTIGAVETEILRLLNRH
jgi:hypothetical protein